VYIAANAPDAGESCSFLAEAYPLPALDDMVTVGPHVFVSRAAYRANLAADLPEDQAWAMSVSQKPVALGSAYEKITAPAWKHKRSWYAVSSEDRIVDPEGQRWSAQRIGAETVEIAGSHYTPASRPDEVAALIVRAAKAVAES
jgi:pimeloyl-ACP methyl ester carboxylesterase